MGLQDGVWRDRLKAALPRIGFGARAVARGVTDLLLPSLAHDSPEAAGSPGLTAGAWSRVTFLEDPVCDGCGAGFEMDGGPFAAPRCAACLAQPYAFARARAAHLTRAYPGKGQKQKRREWDKGPITNLRPRVSGLRAATAAVSPCPACQ